MVPNANADPNDTIGLCDRSAISFNVKMFLCFSCLVKICFYRYVARTGIITGLPTQGLSNAVKITDGVFRNERLTASEEKRRVAVACDA